jgi:hypothetical protein
MMTPGPAAQRVLAMTPQEHLDQASMLTVRAQTASRRDAVLLHAEIQTHLAWASVKSVSA